MDDKNTHDWAVGCDDCGWHGMLSDAVDDKQCPQCGSCEVTSEAFRLLSLIASTMDTWQEVGDG